MADNACDACGNALEECDCCSFCGSRPTLCECGTEAEATRRMVDPAPVNQTPVYGGNLMLAEAYFPAFRILAPTAKVRRFQEEYNALLERHGFKP